MSQTYKKSGVDIDAGDRFVDLIAPAAKKTYRKEVMGGIGPFAALFELDVKKYKNPVIVSSTDGVGTKLKIAIELDKYDTIGQDLVAMCVNDLVCCGAEPLFFLDYFATGTLEPEKHAPIIEGIAKACKTCNCSLIGGETAEMPGMYCGGDFDLAGFAVGVVERDKIINGNGIKPGDAIIGIASSGIHSNGYSLVRKIIKDAKADLKSIGDAILAPTKLYPPLIFSLLSSEQTLRLAPARSGQAYECTNVRAIAHITGGGLLGNIPRILPDDCTAAIDMNTWPRPAIFKLLQEKGGVCEEEMRRVFNLGIGLVLVVEQKNAQDMLLQIEKFGEKAWVIGEIKEKQMNKEVIFT